MNTSKLRDIIAAHQRWLNQEPDGVRININDTNFSDLDLHGADLTGADLRQAHLIGANLRHTNLSHADLRHTLLRHTDLRYTKLLGADLTNADLTGADLRRADLRGADLTNALGLNIADDAPQRLRDVARAALASDCALEMNWWHTCETTHCIAGWAIHQAGTLGRLLEKEHGSASAGLMLLGTEAHRYFHVDNDEARQFLRSVLDD